MHINLVEVSIIITIGQGIITNYSLHVLRSPGCETLTMHQSISLCQIHCWIIIIFIGRRKRTYTILVLMPWDHLTVKHEQCNLFDITLLGILLEYYIFYCASKRTRTNLNSHASPSSVRETSTLQYSRNHFTNSLQHYYSYFWKSYRKTTSPSFHASKMIRSWNINMTI